MKLKKQMTLVLLILVISTSCNCLFSRNIQTKPTRQSSLEAFSKGNYEQAYKEFSELLLTYSKDPLYKYYSGVCLVKLNRNPGEAVNLLNQAFQGASVVKTLPSDALFYLGRAQQMSGRFIEAAGSYNLYSEQVGKKTAREQGIPEFIQQCIEKKGKVTEPEIKPSETVIKNKDAISQTVTKPTLKEVIQPPVKEDVSAKKNLPVSYEKILNEALDLQFKADSLFALAGEQKKKLEKLQNAEKPALKVKISENELLAASFQKSADQKYGEAQVAMNPQKEKTQQRDTLQQSDNKVIKDTIKQSDNKVVRKVGEQSDTIKRIVPVVKKPIETFAFFEVLPKPVTDPNEKIAIDTEVPPGLIYRIQIAVFRNLVAPLYFRGITPVYGFKIAGTDKTIYYAGMFRRSSDANKALAAVKAKGFKDAFVVALTGNKLVSADRAAILEKEWRKKPFMGLMKSVPEASIDTVPPTLSFRVEVIRSLKPLKEDVIEGIKKMAGNRGLDIQSLNDGNIAYLVGKFITFESAAEYADLMIRNGYREAKVVAWLGKKEIRVETARQLFENLE
ncbi:MAG: SPOR domain-containing protein [Bacteroidia bacterium]|nr:SPOR domain-containing protein [Bacteroidia bacterium]